MMAFAQKAPQGVTYEADVLRVTDGDTVVIAAPYLPQPLKPQLAVRIYGIDTPEKGTTAKCPAEIEKGKAATLFTRTAVNNSQHRQVIIYGWDKYGGRILGDIILDGQSLRQLVISNGYAYEYYGGFKRSWCN